MISDALGLKTALLFPLLRSFMVVFLRNMFLKIPIPLTLSSYREMVFAMGNFALQRSFSDV